MNFEMHTVPKKIAGLTTFCDKQWLDRFLTKLNAKQHFALYEGPPEFLPSNSPIFIFQKGINQLRAIARFTGYLEINGWLGELRKDDTEVRTKRAKHVVEQLFAFYKAEGILRHITHEEAIKFFSNKDGVRGMFFFDRIIEIKYDSRREWIRYGEVVKLFRGRRPYAQGFPYRYLSEDMVKSLIQLILKRSKNSINIIRFLKDSLRISTLSKAYKKKFAEESGKGRGLDLKEK